MAQAKRAAEGKLDSRKASVTRRPSSRSLSSAKFPLSTDPVTGASLRKVLTHVCKSKTCGRAFETTVREKEYCSPQCGNRERQRQQRCRNWLLARVIWRRRLILLSMLKKSVSFIREIV